LVDRIAAGTRVSVMGVCSLHNGTAKNGKSNKLSYIQAIGVQVDEFGGGRSSSLSLTPQEEEDMTKLSRDPEIYDKISRSIAPQISGDYTVDIKKALACLLMSGSRKVFIC
jgi:DNA replication licensing factor MCM5